MAEKTENTTQQPAAETSKSQGKKIFCFISKHDIDEADVVEMPYVNGTQVWINKVFVHFKQ